MKNLIRKKDIINSSINLEQIYKVKNFPVFMGTVEHSKKEDIFADMIWEIGKETGMIQLKELIPLDILYSSNHSSGVVGKLWSRHHEEFAKFISKFNPNKVFEIGGAHGILAKKYETFIKQYSYYHEQDLDSIFYRYVPTYIGYTKDSLRINKYTWEVLNTSDAEKADRLKYVYNSEGPLLNPTNRVYNYQIQKEEMNTLKYYDCIYINKPTIHTNLLSNPICYLLSYKQELSGTSCGPNDTNTMVLNPILPELKRFNIKIWRINELGEHIEIPITKNGVFRVIMSFTIYYKRKKVTRV